MCLFFSNRNRSTANPVSASFLHSLSLDRAHLRTIGSRAVQKAWFIPIGSFLSSSSSPLCSHTHTQCYTMCKKSDIHSLARTRTPLAPSFLWLYKNANKRMCKKAREERARARTIGRERDGGKKEKSEVSPMCEFLSLSHSLDKKRAFCRERNLSDTQFVVALPSHFLSLSRHFISFLSIKLILTFLNKWYFH